MHVDTRDSPVAMAQGSSAKCDLVGTHNSRVWIPMRFVPGAKRST